MFRIASSHDGTLAIMPVVRSVASSERVRIHLVVRAISLGALALAGVVACGIANAQGPYKVQQRWLLGGEGSWDYVTIDPGARHLYIAHLTRVEVVDLNSGKRIGSVDGLAHCHGTVFTADGKVGFISDGGSNNVVVFDPTTLKIEARIAVGTNPDGMVYERSTNTLWAFNGGSNNVTVIDVGSRKILATVAMPGKPEFPATDGAGTIFVNVEDNNSVARIDAKKRNITAVWKLTGCESPSGLALDSNGHRLFSVCDGKKMAVTDALTGRSLGNPSIGEGADAAAYDRVHNVAFASNEDGTLTVIDASTSSYPRVQTLQTMKGARTMAFDPSTGRLYTVSAKLGALPPPNPAVHHNRPPAVPDTFTVLVISRN